MTPRDGFSNDMYRFVDAGADERLIAGSIDVADAPRLYRAVAVRLQALREAPESWELAGEQDAVEQIAAAVMLERQARPVRRARRSSSRVAALAATAVVVCALPLTGGLASAGALPEPAQNLTSAVLDKVGISVPTGARDPVDDVSATRVPRPGGSEHDGTGPGRGRAEPRRGRDRRQTLPRVLRANRARRLPATARSTTTAHGLVALPRTKRTVTRTRRTAMGAHMLRTTRPKVATATGTATTGSRCNAAGVRSVLLYDPRPT